MGPISNCILVANEGTVSAAAESAGDNLELTDAVLANLTDLHLTDIDFFKFGDDGESAYKRGLGFASCKTMPGDLTWPGKVVWKVFNLLTGGALIKTVPFGAVCYEGEHYDADACARIIDNWTNSDTQFVDPFPLRR